MTLQINFDVGVYQTYRQSYRNLHTFHLTGAKTVFYIISYLQLKIVNFLEFFIRISVG